MGFDGFLVFLCFFPTVENVENFFSIDSLFLYHRILSILSCRMDRQFKANYTGGFSSGIWIQI